MKIEPGLTDLLNQIRKCIEPILELLELAQSFSWPIVIPHNEFYESLKLSTNPSLPKWVMMPNLQTNKHAYTRDYKCINKVQTADVTM